MLCRYSAQQKTVFSTLNPIHITTFCRITVKKEKVSKFNKLYFDFSCNLVYDYYIGVLLPVIITIAGSL